MKWIELLLKFIYLDFFILSFMYMHRKKWLEICKEVFFLFCFYKQYLFES